MAEIYRPRIVITPKPPPSPLAPFECAVCEREIEREPYRPDMEEPPVCFRCSMRVPTRPQLAGVGVEQWASFYRVHSLLCAIKEEISRARCNH